MHEVTIRKKEADTNRLRQQEDKRSNLAKEKIDIGQFDDKKVLEVLKIIFGKGGVVGAAANAINDPRWYISNPELSKYAASFPAYQRNAEVFDYTYAKRVTGTDVQLGKYISALYKFNVALTLGGQSQLQDSGINVAARTLYNRIRQANSSASAYDPGEVMKIIYCVLSVYILLTSSVKMLRFTKSMDEFDPNLQYKIPTYFNTADMIANRANWKTYINYVIKQLGAFPIPGNLPIFSRELWLAGVALVDAKHKNRSIYHVEHQYLYSWDDANDVAQCINVDNYSPLDLAGFQTMINGLLTNLTNSSIAVTVYRDIVQAADKGLISVFKFPEFTDAQFESEMTYIDSSEVLNQFHNATIMGELSNVTDLNIVDNSSDGVQHNDTTPEFRTETIVGYQPMDVSNAAYYSNPLFPMSKKYLSMLDDDVSSDRVLVASRFAVNYEWTIPTSGIVTADAIDFGTEIVTSVAAGFIDRSGGITSTVIDASVAISEMNNTALSAWLLALEVSNYLPAVYFNLVGASDKVFFPKFRDERIVELDTQALRKLHTLAQQGLFEYR